jgi:hypothetical protein
VTRRCTIVALLLSLIATPLPAGATSGGKSLLSVGVTGSVQSEGKGNPTYLMRPLEVQRLLLAIAEEPRELTYASRTLEASDITVDDLLGLKLLRRDEDRLVINFNFLTQQDQAEIVRVATPHAVALADGYLQHREEIEAILANRGLPDVPVTDYAYILIGCFSLDWDGLRFTDDPRFRAAATHRSGGDLYTPWAKERGDRVSLKGLYWGSHNDYRKNANLTTFGDHHSLPRAGFPDMAWILRVDTDRLPGDGETRETTARAARWFLHEMADAVGKVMFSLGNGAKSLDELTATTSLGAETLSDLLALLEEIEYVAVAGSKYRATIPVLTDTDTPMVRDLLSLGRQVIRRWHEEHYDALASELSHLTPLKYEVPYGVVYTEIWHYVFALANRELIKAGLLADPYAGGRRHKGFIPAVWRPGQERLEGGSGPTVGPH